MPLPIRHRTQRERAAIHFLSNISLDGASDGNTRSKRFNSGVGDSCDCDKCRTCLVPNENFVRPTTVMTPTANASPQNSAIEEAESELMDLWSLKSSTLKSNNGPMGDIASHANPWSWNDRPMAKNWSHPKIKMGSPRSILKRAINKRLIFTDGKPGAPIMMTSVLPFNDLLTISGQVTPEPTSRPDSRETLRPSSPQTVSLRGRQADTGSAKARTRRESERSLSPTHRLLSGTHALANDEQLRRKHELTERANRIVTSVLPRRLQNKKAHMSADDDDAEYDGRGAKMDEGRGQSRVGKLKPIHSKIELTIDPPKDVQRETKRKSQAPTRESGLASTPAEVKVKDVKPQQMLKLIRGLLLHKQREGGEKATTGAAATPELATSSSLSSSKSSSTQKIEISFKSLLNSSSGSSRNQIDRNSETPSRKGDNNETPEKSREKSTEKSRDKLTEKPQDKSTEQNVSAASSTSALDNRAKRSSPNKPATEELGPMTRKDSKRSKKSWTNSIETICFKGLVDEPYDPFLLDDPELRAGKHKTILTFPSYMTSVIPYASKEQLKAELNDQFRKRFPDVQLTLSKLRSLKRELLQIGLKCQLELATVSTAYVYFEKIVLRRIVNKQNRKVVAANCLVIAAKLHDVKGMELSGLLVEIEEVFRVNARDVLAFEMFVLVALEFDLKLRDQEVYPHFQRIRNEI